MSNENLYRDFIEAVRQDSEVCKDLIADTRYACEKIAALTEIQRKNLIYLEKRSLRLDELFNRICASNDTGMDRR